MTISCTWCAPFYTAMRRAAHGVLYVAHRSLALVGLAVTLLGLVLWLQPRWWQDVEAQFFHALRERQIFMSWLPDNAAERATAANLQDLPPAQAAVASWLGRKYKVAPEPLAALVAEAHVLSLSAKLPAHLILAVMAIESGFHPYVQSHAGAQGLMQVMTGIHRQKYELYGGTMAAFDPLANLRVGTAVLADAIRLRNGSVEEGLKFYLGGYALTEDGGYVAKVLEEKARLDQVAAGQKVSFQ